MHKKQQQQQLGHIRWEQSCGFPSRIVNISKVTQYIFFIGPYNESYVEFLVSWWCQNSTSFCKSGNLHLLGVPHNWQTGQKLHTPD